MFSQVAVISKSLLLEGSKVCKVRRLALSGHLLSSVSEEQSDMLAD